MKLAGDTRHAEEPVTAQNNVGSLKGWKPAVKTREYMGK
jgi:hypothetical protein